MYTVPSVNTMQDDYELFVHLGNGLEATQGSWLQRLFSSRRCSQVHLSKFTFLFNACDIVKAARYQPKSGSATPDLRKDGYDYSCYPDIDAEEHMGIVAEMILQGLQNPTLGRGGRAVLSGMPKLESPPGLCREQHKWGWGFYMSQDLCIRLMLAWLGVVLSLGVTFAPAWLAAVDARDVQTALTPLSVLSNVMMAVTTITLGFEALATRR